MKKLIGLIAFGFTFNASAADSTWLICDGSKIVANSFEHRVGSADRANELTLITGGTTFIGQVEDASEESRVTMTSPSGYTYKGSVKVDYQTYTIRFDGVVTNNQGNVLSKISKTLTCKEVL